MKFCFGWLAVLLALSAGVANAQNSSPLAGSVQDTTGAIIIGAEITVVAQDGSIIAQGTTDRAGNFRFTGLAAGTYTVVVDHPGFREVRQAAGADSGLDHNFGSFCRSPQ